jgi:hypothetical protein
MKGDQKAKLVTNIVKRIKVREKILDAAVLYQKYYVQKGERPEDVAHKHFGKAEYHWILLLTNGITDAYYGWPMGYAEFETFIKDKYTNPEAIHHHEKPQSSGNADTMIECASSDSGAVSVSNREYEQRIQDDMSEIKLLDQGYLPAFLDEFDKLMSE